MAFRIKVEITKTCLSFLFRDNANSFGDQEGFLLGQVSQVQGRDINDTDAEQATETTVIRITSHMSMPKPCVFYNPVGTINPDKIEEILGPFKDKVVGYFDFKREFPVEMGTRPTFRMSSLFHELCKWVSANQTPTLQPSTNRRSTLSTLASKDNKTNQVALLVLRQNHSESKGIINNTYCFYHFNDKKKLEKIGSSIPNLGDTSHSLYISDPPVSGVDELIKKKMPQLPPMVPEQMPVVQMHRAMMQELEQAGRNVDLAHQSLRDATQRRQDTDRRIETVQKDISKILAGRDLAESLNPMEMYESDSSPDQVPGSSVQQALSASPATPLSAHTTPLAVKLNTSTPNQFLSTPKSKIKVEITTPSDTLTPGVIYKIKKESECSEEKTPKKQTEVPVKVEQPDKDEVENASAVGNQPQTQSPVIGRKTRHQRSGSKLSLKK